MGVNRGYQGLRSDTYLDGLHEVGRAVRDFTLNKIALTLLART